MRRLIAVVASMLVMSSSVNAGPLVDILIGAAIIGNGVYFETQRASAKSKKDDAQKKATTDLTQWQIDLVEANYYKGAADLEFFYFGATSDYFALNNRFMSKFSSSQSRLSSGLGQSNIASDEKDKENLYKGVSLTSFGVGGFFIVKGAVTYFYRKHKSKQEARSSWIQNVSVGPNYSMDGAMVKLDF